MPTPNNNETENQFIQRCMGDDEAINDFPNEDQRYAFCQSQWDRKEINRIKSIKKKGTIILK